MNKTYTIGIDYGTLSGRAVLVDTFDGTVVASAVHAYTHGVMDASMPDGTPLPNDWALQHPADYLEVLEVTVPQLLRDSGVHPEQIIGIGIDVTAATVMPVKRSGIPLCMLPEYQHEPHAYVKLWKHHAAQSYATRMAEVAAERGEDWLSSYGGTVSSEWSLPKLWQVLEEAPQIYTAMDDWMDACDWIVWQLCGQRVQSLCSAGYKCFYRKEGGFPSEDYFAALDERLRTVVRDKLSAPVRPIGSKAGELTEHAANRLGLAAGTSVAVSMIDAHACVPAAGIHRAGQLLAIIGTSTCYMALDSQKHMIPGISGIVQDGILPGSWGYEAGQSCVGDLFAWFADRFVPERYTQEAASKHCSVHQYLSELMRCQKPGEHGLVALDWWNGNRSILSDSDLSGLIIGMTLRTKPEDVYRALVESTAYGARVIVDNFENHGLHIDEVYISGGICQKNEVIAQIYADVLNRPLHIVSAKEGGALGSAIIAAAASGAYTSIPEAICAMSAPSVMVYHPNSEYAAAYQKLYGLYRSLHDAFGREYSDFMHTLKAIKRSSQSDIQD